MKDLIAGMIDKDHPLEIAFVTAKGDSDIFRGNFVSSNDNALAVRLSGGKVRLLPISSISYLDILSYESDETADSRNISDSTSRPAHDASYTTAGDKADVFSNTPILSTPKVVGRIDLNDIGRTSRFRKPYEPEEEEYEIPEELIPAMGKISRMGPNFGFIQPNDSSAPAIYMARGEIISIHGVIKAPNVGDEVIYTPSLNRQGTAAKCVHRRCSLHTLEEMASRLQAYDPRNTAILKARIKAVQDGTPLEEAFPEQSFEQFRRQRPAADQQESLDSDTVMAMIGRDETVSARNITECEDALFATLPYSEFIEALDKLLGYAMEHNLTAVHRLLSRGIRVARENNDNEKALSYARKACEYYHDMPGNFKFFSALEYRLSQSLKSSDNSENSENCEGSESSENSDLSEDPETGLITI